MEAVHAIPADDEIEIAEPAREPAARTATPSKMFKYSEYLDVGDGAEDCEHARDGECADVEHFHAWCRLPNPYQHQDIRAKGLAAKARRIRLLRDPESDESVVLDLEVGDSSDPAYVETLIEELLTADWGKDYIEATTDVEEREEYEHIAQDREELTRLSEGDLPEDEQSDAYKRLAKHMRGYLAAVQTQLEDIQTPKREALLARPIAEVIALVRNGRVEEEANRAFLDDYSAWMWFVGTFHVDPHKTLKWPHKPMWDDIGRRDRPAAGTMFGEAPEVIEALKATYNELQLALQRGSAGN